MAFSSQYMAEVNSTGNNSPATLKQFWSAASLLTLTTTIRLIRNFRHYSPEHDQQADPQIIENTLRDLRHAMHSYRGLLTQLDRENNEDDSERDRWYPAIIALREHIYQQWYYLHQQLLFFPTDRIEALIPLVDQQLKTWKTDTDSDSDASLLLTDLFHPMDQLRAQITQLWYQHSDS